MNRSLVYFSVFLILIGIGFGFYVLSLLGAILLIPSLLSPTQLPARRAPGPTQPQPPRRIIPPKPAHPVAPATEPATAAPSYTPMQYQGFTGALFPGPMFPSLSQMGAPQPTAGQTPPASQGRDELLEVGAILAVLKLLSG